MSKKFKAMVRLNKGEAYVVASVEFWDHIISTYQTLAEQLESPDDKIAWENLAEHVAYWVNETAYYPEDDDDDDEGWN